MTAVSIIYSPDGESWFNYFSNYLKRVFVADIKVESIQDTDLHQVTFPNSKVQNIIHKSKVNIFIVSPGYIHFLISNSDLPIRDVLSNPRRTVVFLCGTILDDFDLEDSKGQKIVDRFPRFNKECCLSYPKHDEMLELVVRLLEPEPRSNRGEASASLGRGGEAEEGKTKIPQHKSNGKRKRKSTSFKFIPSQVHCEGSSVVVISFDELVASEEHEVNVEVEIEGGTDADGPTRVMALWINPYTYQFTAPERRSGILKAQLFMQGKAVGSEDLEYASPLLDAIVGLHLIYIRQLNELCSILNENHLLTNDVDRRMSKVLRDESDDLIPVAAFEYFHGVHRFQSADASGFELPTMFHLTAKYGLQELGQQLTDLPDARHSYCIYNSDGKLPEEIARFFNHPALATTFENFREGDTFQQLYDSYIVMRGSNPVKGDYLNRGLRQDMAEGSGDEYDYEDVPSELTCTNQFSSWAKDNQAAKRMEEKLRAQDADKAGTLSQNYVEELENPYECRFRKQQLAPPTRFIEDGPPTTIPRNQQELIGIMEQVKNKQLTMSDAEVLFKEWQIRHQKKPASIKQKEDSLAKIREETEKTSKKDTFQFYNFLGKKGTTPASQYIPEIMPGTKQPRATTTAVEAIKSAKPVRPEVSADRSSTTSSSNGWRRHGTGWNRATINTHTKNRRGRESTCSVRSRASTTSGIDIDETIQEEAAPKLLPKPRGNCNRRSVCLQKLEKELTSPGALEPPPLPPRVQGQTLPRPGIPIPKLNKIVAKQDDEGENNSSPDDYYIDLESENTNISVTSDDMYMIMETQGKRQTDRESPSTFIHQESMPELHNPPFSEQPRKSSLPDIVNPTSVPIPRIPCTRVPEESEEYDSSSNSTMAKQFQLPKEFLTKQLRKVPTQVKPTVPALSAAPPPKPKPLKVPPSVPQKNK